MPNFYCPLCHETISQIRVSPEELPPRYRSVFPFVAFHIMQIYPPYRCMGCNHISFRDSNGHDMSSILFPFVR